MFNDTFDILNSRSLNCYGFKKALCASNYQQIAEFTETFSSYVKSIKCVDGQLVINSNRKTGFLICFESLLKLYSLLILPKKLMFLPIYKCSQDHLEIFFGAIRSHGGYNNNPTARQFHSAYRKLIIHATIRDGGLGNCIPQDQIEPTDSINETCLIRNIDVEFDAEQLHLQDHDYIANTNSLSPFSEEA
ncbi:unnamed protein product [Macrosiphum euphorbiae]|uniref:Transposable element P transposase-like RNase H C-terminal domain-containing protein n=1 Tax=Macrosiphum euphorbiae TaxID=13131 RepID=A0AAV0Y818_9HEMI|nr:unnamed protein product [Macrosiphum euphorbiae]